MTQATSEQLKLIDVRASLLLRALLIVPVVLAIIGAFYASRWYLGNTLAEFAPGVQEGGIETTRRAIELAPGDPLAYWSAANQENRSLDPSRVPEALRLYEEAVRRSPYDYRYWQDLGRVREQAGDIAGSEKAFRQTIKLAPAYSYPHWYLGNLLLRNGRTDEAFAELRRAADINSLRRPQVFEAAWQVYDKDVAAVERVVGDAAEVRAQLAVFLAGKERADEAVRLWTNLSGAEKKAQRKTGEELVKSLFVMKHFHAAQTLAHDLGLESASGPGQIVNGDFESGISAPGQSLFGWQISPVSQTEVTLDTSQHHGGSRSLRLIFNGFAAPGYYNISQLVVVEQGTRYRFEGYIRTQDLKSGGAPLIEIANTLDGKVIGTSAPFPLGRNDWQPVTVDFTTPEKTEAIYIRTNRAFCGEVCPIFGIIWYDDFNLQRLGQSGDARPEGNTAVARDARASIAR